MGRTDVEKKKKKFREISWESIKISRDILRLNSPRLEEKAAEKFFPVRSSIFGWMDRNDLSSFTPNDSGTMPKETAERFEMVEKLLEEVESMNKSIALQNLQLKAVEYSLGRAIEKVDKKIEELCKVQFKVLEKIADLKSIDNQIKVLSVEVPKQVPSERPTLSEKKKEVGSLCGGVKYCQNPPQEASVREMPGKVSEDKKVVSHPKVKKNGPC